MFNSDEGNVHMENSASMENIAMLFFLGARRTETLDFCLTPSEVNKLSWAQKNSAKNEVLEFIYTNVQVIRDSCTQSGFDD